MYGGGLPLPVNPVGGLQEGEKHLKDGCDHRVGKAGFGVILKVELCRDWRAGDIFENKSAKLFPIADCFMGTCADTEHVFTDGCNGLFNIAVAETGDEKVFNGVTDVPFFVRHFLLRKEFLQTI